MRIVDSQIHLWNAGQAPAHHRQAPYLAEQAIADMDLAGVHVAINHPPGWSAEANAYADQAAALYPTRFATLASLKLDHPDAAQQVRAIRQRPGVIGLRFLCLAEDERAWPRDGTMDWLWPLAQDMGLPIALCGPTLLPLVESLAERYPALKLTVDHLGFVSFTPSIGLIQHPDLLRWARFPNVAVKLSGTPGYAQSAYPFLDMHGTVRQLYDAFGPERLFWGTDITRLCCSWREAITMFTEEMPWLNPHDKDLIMGRALCQWHGLEAA
jgi:predicted TIM-barrel fold metal-dependent hydrolase